MTETTKTAEQLAAEAASAKEAAKAQKAAEKAAAKAEKEAAAAEAKAAAKAEREAQRAAAAEAKAAEKKAAKAEREPAPEQNGVRAYKPGTIGGNLWAAFNAASNELNRPVSFAEAQQAVVTHGVAAVPASVRAGYARWKKFHGLSGRITAPVAPEAQATA
jgi:membrane protein involved in colicin uptake